MQIGPCSKDRRRGAFFRSAQCHRSQPTENGDHDHEGKSQGIDGGVRVADGVFTGAKCFCHVQELRWRRLRQSRQSRPRGSSALSSRGRGSRLLFPARGGCESHAPGRDRLQAGKGRVDSLLVEAGSRPEPGAAPAALSQRDQLSRVGGICRIRPTTGGPVHSGPACRWSGVSNSGLPASFRASRSAELGAIDPATS